MDSQARRPRAAQAAMCAAAPVLLASVALLLSWRVFDAYRRLPYLDVAMHVAGGIVAAGFAACMLTFLEERGSLLPGAGVLRGLLVFSLATTCAVFWELCEFLSDVIFGTTAQKSLPDTMGDLACSMGGGVLYLATAAAARGVRSRRSRIPEHESGGTR